jgi:hypothetical protein
MSPSLMMRVCLPTALWMVLGHRSRRDHAGALGLSEHHLVHGLVVLHSRSYDQRAGSGREGVPPQRHDTAAQAHLQDSNFYAIPPVWAAGAGEPWLTQGGHRAVSGVNRPPMCGLPAEPPSSRYPSLPVSQHTAFAFHGGAPGHALHKPAYQKLRELLWISLPTLYAHPAPTRITG